MTQQRTSTPLVSILIPCYNAASWLSAALESALSQSWTKIEVILVDDGSSDRSLAIAQQYVSRGVRVFTQSNQGASAARNQALRQAHGDYIQYLDADDVLATDKIERQLVSVDSTEERVVFSSRWARFFDTPENATFSTELLCANFTPIDFVVRKFTKNAMMHPAAWLVPRALSDLVGPWNERLSLDDDGEYFNRVILASQRIHYCPDAITYYRSGLKQSLSRKRSDRAWESHFLSVELSITQLLTAENSPQTRQAGADALQRLIFDVYPRRPDLRSHALARIQELGGSRLRYEAGPKYQLAARLLGWKAAKRARNLFR